jgi:hypothetical protein
VAVSVGPQIGAKAGGGATMDRLVKFTVGADVKLALGVGVTFTKFTVDLKPVEKTVCMLQ